MRNTGRETTGLKRVYRMLKKILIGIGLGLVIMVVFGTFLYVRDINRS